MSSQQPRGRMVDEDLMGSMVIPVVATENFNDYDMGESMVIPVVATQNVSAGGGGRGGEFNPLMESMEIPVVTTVDVQAPSMPRPNSNVLEDSMEIPVVSTQEYHHDGGYQHAQPAGQLNDDDLMGSFIVPVAVAESVQVVSVINSNKKEETFDQDRATRYFKDQGFTSGLITALINSKREIAKRYWVIDNSGSMLQNDGQRLAYKKGKAPVLVQSTRWKELQQNVNSHAEMSAYLEAPTQFKLINKPGLGVTTQKFEVGELPDIKHEISNVKEIMDHEPSGVSLITKGVREVTEEIRTIRNLVAEQGKRIHFILATDGLPSDKYGGTNKAATEQLMTAFRDLEAYPVWFIIRLCTDDQETVDFYNGLDTMLERNVEVMLDIHTEAKEVNKVNSWLTYGLPLHSCREMGLRDRVLDMLDERLLTKEEMVKFCSLLFGKQVIENLPDPLYDWNDFMSGLQHVVSAEGCTWNPVTKKLDTWINMKELNKAYGENKEKVNPKKSNTSSSTSTTVQQEAKGGCGCVVS